jgi:serine/threonine-protein kinase
VTDVPLRAATWRQLLLWGLGAVAAVTGAALVGHHLSAPTRLAPHGGAIAVLPFDDLSAAPEDAYLAAGMGEELRTTLGRVPGMRVAPVASAGALKARAADPREIGRRLGVEYVLAGGVSAVGDSLRVTARVVSTTNGFPVWAEEYWAARRDEFAVQARIADAIVGSLRLRLADTTTPSVHRPPTDPVTYDLYQKGRYFRDQRDRPGLARAVQYFSEAVAHDALFAPAWSGLGDAYSMSGVFGYEPPRDVFPRARAAITRALALDSTLAEAHASLGTVLLFYDWDWPAARRELDLAIALDSSHSPAHLLRAWYFVAVDSVSQALAELRAAQVRDPLSLIIDTRVASMLALLGRWDEAVAQARRTIDLDSTYLQARVELAVDLAWSGQCGPGLEAARDLPLSPDSEKVMGVRAVVLAACGRHEAAREPLRWLEAERRRRYVSPSMIAPVYAALGDEPRARAWLDTAYVDRTWYIVQLQQDPNYRRYRADQWFKRLLQRIGLSPATPPR